MALSWFGSRHLNGGSSNGCSSIGASCFRRAVRLFPIGGPSALARRWPFSFGHSRGLESQGILARFRWQAPWPRGKGGDVRLSPVSFPICLHLRRLIIGLNVPVSVECEPDKSNRQQDGAGYDQPMWISHLKHSQLSRRFSLLECLRTTFRAAPAARRRGDSDCSF